MATAFNTALATLAVLHQGASAPTTASTGLASMAGAMWHDTANNLLKLRDQADTTWITVGAFDETNKLFTPYLNGTALATPSAEGFVNRLRNSSLTSWFHGTAGTITTAGGWTAEGVYAVPTGASITWAQVTTVPTGCLTVNGVKLTGASSVSDIAVRFVLESYAAAQLAGQTVTFQLPIINNAGTSITPTIATKYPTAHDNWASSTTDLAATNLQAVANNASGTLSYTFTVAANAVNGYEIVIDFGNNFSSAAKSVTLGGGFDLRATPGVTTGLNAAPPSPEVRDAASDIAWNRRFVRSSYDNGTAPGTAATVKGARTMMSHDDSGQFVAWSLDYGGPGPMRADPTFTYYDLAGTASAMSDFSNGSQTNGVTVTTTITAGESAALFNNTAQSGASVNTHQCHFFADSSIVGA
jgi:hypothetical protein